MDIPDVSEPALGIPTSIRQRSEEGVLAVLPDEIAFLFSLRAFELRTSVFLDNLLHNLCGIVNRGRRRAL